MKLSFFKNMFFFSPIKKKFTWLDTWIFFFHQQFFFPCFTIKKLFKFFSLDLTHEKKIHCYKHKRTFYIKTELLLNRSPERGGSSFFYIKKRIFMCWAAQKWFSALKKNHSAENESENVFFPLFHTWKEHFRTSKKGPAEKKEILERNIFWRWIKRITFQAEWKKCFSSMKKKKNH